MADLNVVELPQPNVGDLAAGLRRLADQIERGERGKAHNVVWVIDEGGGKVAVGLLGKAGEPGAVGCFLLSLGLKQIMDGVSGG